MGLGQAVLLGSVLLLCRGGLHAASQNHFNLSSDPGEPGPPRTTPDRTLRSPVSYRLKSYQLRQKPVPQLTPDQPREPLRPLVPGPDLNPPVHQEPKVLVEPEQRVPVPADSVAVRCGEAGVTVEVRLDFLGNGQRIHPGDLTLGGCAALDTADHVLQFEAELQGCGSTTTVTEEALVYSFSLTYSPTPIGSTFILKTNPGRVVIQCHYQRRHYVSSNAVRPTWTPFASKAVAGGEVHFSLRLMTADWQSPRPPGSFLPGDVMHVEAAVAPGYHVPLRVHVDSCVASAGPDPASRPRYPFISNHGCLTDAKLTGAKSYFMQRSREDKLHFLLEAFRFQRDHRDSLYITCRLRATTVSAPVDSQHKACSFLPEANRWVASGGDNKVCGCCETSCGEGRRRRGLAADAEVGWEGTAALGPILLETELRAQEVTRAASSSSSSSSPSLLGGVGAALLVLLVLLTGATVCSRHRRKSAGHAVST